MHDLHATMLHLLGIDHEKLTYRFQGRDFRLTDVHGKAVGETDRVALCYRLRSASQLSTSVSGDVAAPEDATTRKRRPSAVTSYV